MLWVEVETEEEPIQTVSDTAGLHMNPSGEITVFFDKLTFKKFEEKEFHISKGYDEASRNLIAGIYYFEHQEVNNNRLIMTYKGDGLFDIYWRGVTTDISYYDGSKPDTIVEVSGECTFEEYMDWL